MFIIYPTIRNGFDINCDIFLQILHAINKVQLYCSIFSILKLLQSCFHPSANLFDPFVSFLCRRLFNISSTCPRHVCDPVKCKVRFLFCDAFHCCLLGMFYSVLQCLSSLKFSFSLFSWLKPLCAFESSSGISGSSGSSGSGSSTSGSSGCFSCFYSSWRIFIPRLQWLSGLWSSSYFASNIVKRSDDSVYQLHFVSPSLKIFCICTEAVWFWVQSNLSWKIQPLRWK